MVELGWLRRNVRPVGGVSQFMFKLIQAANINATMYFPTNNDRWLSWTGCDRTRPSSPADQTSPPKMRSRRRCVLLTPDDVFQVLRWWCSVATVMTAWRHCVCLVSVCFQPSPPLAGSHAGYVLGAPRRSKSLRPGCPMENAKRRRRNVSRSIHVYK